MCPGKLTSKKSQSILIHIVSTLRWVIRLVLLLVQYLKSNTMKKIPYFPEIDFDDLDEYYDTSIPFENGTIDIDLNFDNDSVNESIIDKLNNFLNNLSTYHAQNLQTIQQDYIDGDTVRDYLQFHLKLCSQEEINKLIDKENTEETIEERLIKAIRLIRVGLYPEQEEGDYFAIFDYSFGEDFTNHLVVISLTENGTFDYITIES